MIDLDRREAKAQYLREWRKKNADKVRAYRAANAAQIAAQQRAARYRRRVAARLEETEIIYSLWCETSGEEPTEPIDARELVAHWETTGIANTCAGGCGRPWRVIAHAIPLAEGGSHSVSNLIPTCGRWGCTRREHS